MEPGLRDREYRRYAALSTEAFAAAAMEPGLRDREYPTIAECWEADSAMLQWSPVLETGNTRRRSWRDRWRARLQWSPVLETGNTC